MYCHRMLTPVLKSAINCLSGQLRGPVDVFCALIAAYLPGRIQDCLHTDVSPCC